jgi:hypothetical protein
LPYLFEDGRGSGPDLVSELLALPDTSVDLIPMIVVVGQRGMHLGQRDAGMARYDLVRAHPHPFVPDGDVLDLDPMAEDVRLAAAVAGLDADMLGDDRQRGRLRRGHCCGCRRGFHTFDSTRKRLEPATPIEEALLNKHPCTGITGHSWLCSSR